MEPRKRKTLLDLDRLPTQKELREFFLANDWSSRKPYDFDEWNQEKIEDKNSHKISSIKYGINSAESTGRRLHQGVIPKIIHLKFSEAM